MIPLSSTWNWGLFFLNMFMNLKKSFGDLQFMFGHLLKDIPIVVIN